MSNGTTKFVDVEKATVALKNKGGQGVLVGGKLILTAAHCVTFSVEGKMVMGHYYVEEIKTKDGALLKVGPWAIEPLSDIAALGELDNNEFSDEVGAFEDFCERTKSVPLFTGTLSFKDSLKVYIYTHKGGWLAGKATNGSLHSGHRLGLVTDEPIEGGTSGGPIVNEGGELVGIVSTSGTGNNGQTPRPLLALPTWICEILNRPTVG